MKAKEAQYLIIGQELEFNDGRIAVVAENDADQRQIQVRFLDGMIGTLRYADFSQIEIIDPNRT